MKKRFIKVISVLMALSLMLLTFGACKDGDDFEKTGEVSTTKTESTTTTQELPKGVNSLTGKKDLSDSAVGARPIAIMVENSPAARPQWGLSTPDVIVEGLVEGGITRMMWIYADAEDIPEKVGPTRSSRHDYVEIAKGMNAIYVHWGGSNGKKFKGNYELAYQAISKLDVDNIDGMKYSGSYFFRDKTRNTSSEHRGCTSGDLIRKAIAKIGYSTEQTVKNWEPFDVSVEGAAVVWGDTSVTGPCAELQVNFSSSYVYTFNYDKENKNYTCKIGSTVRTDGNTGENMTVENVIVMYTPVTTLDTGKGHKEWNLELTRGEGFYVSGGTGQKIYWSKDGKSGALKFQSANGVELVINSGQTWIGVVPEANRSLTKVTE